jgi:hypothetical protein
MPERSVFAGLARRGVPLSPGEAWPASGVHIRVRRGSFTIPAGLDELERKAAIGSRVHPDANSISVRREGGVDVVTWRIVKVHPND